MDSPSDAPCHFGLDLPPRHAVAAFAWCDERARALIAHLLGDPSSPVTRTSEDEREGETSDRGHTWWAGWHRRTYQGGDLELQLGREWSEDGGRRDESFSLHIVRLTPDTRRYAGSLTLRTPNLAMPSGPGTWCVQRLDATDAEWAALRAWVEHEAQ